MRKFRLWVGVILGIICISFAESGMAADKPITFRFTDQHPAKHFLAQVAYKFAENVGKNSGGRLKILVFPGAQLYRDREVIEAVRNNSVEVGNVNIGQWSSIYPSMHVFENMPFEISTELGYQLMDGKIGEEFRKMMAKIGIMPLMWVPTALHDGVSNSKREIQIPDDFKGLMIRVPHPSIQYRVKIFGGAPVSIAASEMFMALQRGTVDGCWTALASFQSRKIYEIQKYLTVFSMSPNFHPSIMNLKAFQRLSPDLQEAVLKSASETQKWGREAVKRAEGSAMENLQKKMKVHTLTSEETNLFQEKLKFQAEDFIKHAGAEGEKLVKIIREIKKEAGK